MTIRCMRVEFWIPKATDTIRDTYCFSTATMVAQMCLKVVLHNYVQPLVCSYVSVFSLTHILHQKYFTTDNARNIHSLFPVSLELSHL